MGDFLTLDISGPVYMECCREKTTVGRITGYILVVPKKFPCGNLNLCRFKEAVVQEEIFDKEDHISSSKVSASQQGQSFCFSTGTLFYQLIMQGSITFQLTNDLVNEFKENYFIITFQILLNLSLINYIFNQA